jgi:hypothetical protein
MGMDAILTALEICCARLDANSLLPVKLPAEVLEVLMSQLFETRWIAAGTSVEGTGRALYAS